MGIVRPSELQGSAEDQGVVIASYLSTLIVGPLAIFIIWAKSRGHSPYRRFQLAQASAAYGILTLLYTCTLFMFYSPHFALLPALFFNFFLCSSIGLALFGALWTFRRRTLVIPIIGHAIFARWFRGIEQSKPIEGTTGAIGTFSHPRELPLRSFDHWVAAAGHILAYVHPGVMPAILLAVQPNASPYRRFQLAQAAASQTMSLLSLIGSSMSIIVLIGIGAIISPYIGDRAERILSVVFAYSWLAAVLVSLLWAFVLPIIAGIGCAFGWRFVIPVIGPMIFRRYFCGASSATYV